MCTAFHYLHICYVITQLVLHLISIIAGLGNPVLSLPRQRDEAVNYLFISFVSCSDQWSIIIFWVQGLRNEAPTLHECCIYIPSWIGTIRITVVKSVAYSEVKETTWGSASLINSSIKERTHWRRQGFKMCIYTKFSSVYHLTYTVRSVPKYNRN